MKKNLLAIVKTLLLVATFTLSFSSCSEENNSSSELQSQLEGTWVFERGVVYTMGQSMEIKRDQLDDLASQLGVSGFYDEVLTFKGSTVNGIAYAINGNKLTVEGFETFSPEVTINGSTLKMFYDFGAMFGVDMTEELYYTKQ